MREPCIGAISVAAGFSTTIVAKDVEDGDWDGAKDGAYQIKRKKLGPGSLRQQKEQKYDADRLQHHCRYGTWLADCSRFVCLCDALQLWSVG